MSLAFGYVKTLLVIILAFALGALGLSLLFSDLGPGETIAGRLVTVALYYLLAGLLIGTWRPRHWWLAGLNAWASVILALFGLLSLSSADQIPEIAAMLLVPLGLTLLGGLAGALVRRRHLFPTVVDRLFPHR